MCVNRYTLDELGFKNYIDTLENAATMIRSKFIVIGFIGLLNVLLLIYTLYMLIIKAYAITT